MKLLPLAPCLCVQVIAPHLQARLDGLSGLPLPQLVRGAAEQVLRTSQLEGQLLEQLFGIAVTAQRPPQAYGVQTQGEERRRGLPHGTSICCQAQETFSAALFDCSNRA